MHTCFSLLFFQPALILSHQDIHLIYSLMVHRCRRMTMSGTPSTFTGHFLPILSSSRYLTPFDIHDAIMSLS